MLGGNNSNNSTPIPNKNKSDDEISQDISTDLEADIKF